MSCPECATVTPVTDETDEEKFHWVVMFNQGGKLYTYMYRNVPYMTDVVQKFSDQHGRFPYRMWVIVGGEMQKVEIK